MGVVSVIRHSGGTRREPAAASPARLKKDPYVRPYTRFQRGGMYRFRVPDRGWRLFRVT